MTIDEWVVLLVKVNDEDERRCLLFMLTDEDWLSEDGRAFLRDAAVGKSELRPSFHPADKSAQRPHWFDPTTVGGPISVVDHDRSVPSWVIDHIGRVDHLDRFDPKGKYSRYYATPSEAYDALLRALAAGPMKEE